MVFLPLSVILLSISATGSPNSSEGFRTSDEETGRLSMGSVWIFLFLRCFCELVVFFVVSLLFVMFFLGNGGPENHCQLRLFAGWTLVEGKDLSVFGCFGR